MSVAELIEKGPQKAKWLISGHLLVRYNRKPAKEGKTSGFFCSKDELAELVRKLQPEADFEINGAVDVLYRRIDKIKLMEAIRIR